MLGLFQKKIFSQVQSWLFLEYAMVHGMDYYGTKFEDVIDNWISKWLTVIKELDIIWLQDLRKNKPELDEKYTTIFLNIPSEILVKRIQKRWAFITNEEITSSYKFLWNGNKKSKRNLWLYNWCYKIRKWSFNWGFKNNF